MPPFLNEFVPRADFQPSDASHEFRNQWIHPGSVFVVLLILGGDVVGRALAQLTGSGLAPVAFSFGWVAYAIRAISSAVGENKLMPPPDTACKIINGHNGYVRENTSWIIGRIMRDYESWMDDRVSRLTTELLDRKADEEREAKNKKMPGSGNNLPRPLQAGLCVSFYRAGQARKGTSGHDIVYYSGFVIAIFQIGIAAIPFGIFGDWSVFLVTAAGIMLAFTTGLLSQWQKEKWACREHSKKTVVLTRGNGAQHAIVVLGTGKGLDLEDLSAGQSNVNVSASWPTRIFILLLAFFWISLLISASGIEENTWFLLAVGGLGILQNIFVAGWPRNPTNFGMPLIYEHAIGETKVMKTLYKMHSYLEQEGKNCPGLPKAMLGIFFPSDLTDKEKRAWDCLIDPRKHEYQVVGLKGKSQLDQAESLEKNLQDTLQTELGMEHPLTVASRDRLEEIYRLQGQAGLGCGDMPTGAGL